MQTASVSWNSGCHKVLNISEFFNLPFFDLLAIFGVLVTFG